MRIIEAAILAVALVTLAGFLFRRDRRPRWLLYLPATALALALVHLVVEGVRWQMVPGYLLVVILFLASLRGTRRATPRAPSRPSRWRAALRITSVLLGSLVLALTAALLVVLPVFALPEPTGPHAVGTTRLSFVDRSRPELFTADPDDHRDLAVQAWYPASPVGDARPEPLWGQAGRVGPLLAAGLGLPRFLFDHLSLVRSHSHPQAPWSGAEAAYPVLIFSHGYAQGFPAQNTVLMEELASHGYAVFSIGHPYEGSAVIYPDGRVVGVSEGQIKRVRDELGRTLPPAFKKLEASHGKAERAAVVRELIHGAPILTASVGNWAADTRFVLDRLEEIDAGAIASSFGGKLDLSRLGVLGMSFGGTTAGEVCLEDSRIKAGVNLDGLQYGRLLDQPVKQPFLFMNSEDAKGVNEPMYERAEGPAYYVTVSGSKHLDYSDLALISPLFKWMGATGPVGGQRMTEIYSAYVLAFFNKYLKGHDSPLLAGTSSPYPEVDLQARVPAEGASHQLAGRIERIENGLLTPIVIKGEPAVPMSLADRMAFHETPGVSVAVINNGVIEWARGYGVREAGKNAPVTPRTIFQAASISKPVAAAGALLLVQQGKLELDTDVNRTLVSWKVPENQFTRENKVTLRGLLSHTAGLTVHGYGGYADGEILPTLAQVLDGAKPANSAPTGADIVPGSRWRYSGGGYSVVQQLAIDVSGRPFTEFMRDSVLPPLGMTDSTFQQPLGERWSRRAVSGHGAEGTVIAGAWHTYPEMAAAGLWTTPTDLCRFTIALQQAAGGDSHRLLSPETARLMLTPGLGEWGLGVGLKGTGRASRFSHSGSNEGFRATLIAYRETGQGAVVMTNAERGGDLVQEVLFAIAKEYAWPDYAPREKMLAKVHPDVYDLYTGAYEMSPELTVTVSREEQALIGEAQGRRYELLPESETSFFTLTGLEVRFVRDTSGRVTHLVLNGSAEARKLR